ncbi:MAG: hypothetical protein EP298_05500 [Gammaproteobacteria bacterium]|nr:MAG: hypothetical protein EP298_05500 [Gammaproteobacteria bacterium]UTW42730.1 hypothetical protein KFE69_00865 [bacterium SCSIO 12844]
MFENVVTIISSFVKASQQRKEAEIAFKIKIDELARNALEEYKKNSSSGSYEACKKNVNTILKDLSDSKITPLEAIKLLCKQGHFNDGTTYISSKASFNTNFYYNLALWCAENYPHDSDTSVQLVDNKNDFIALSKDHYIDFMLNTLESSAVQINANRIRGKQVLSPEIMANAIAILHHTNPVKFYSLLQEAKADALAEFKGSYISDTLFSYISQNYNNRCENVKKIAVEVPKDAEEASRLSQKALFSLCYEGGWSSGSYNTSFLFHLCKKVSKEVGLSCVTKIGDSSLRDLVTTHNQTICGHAEVMVGSPDVVELEKGDSVVLGHVFFGELDQQSQHKQKHPPIVMHTKEELLKQRELDASNSSLSRSGTF